MRPDPDPTSPHAAPSDPHDAGPRRSVPLDPAAPPQIAPERIGPWRRAGYLLLAGFFFLLGLIGIILPGLPTTPFLLLTSYFLARSWPRLNDALLRSRFFGSILRDWQQRGGLQRHIKIKAVAVVVLGVGLSVYFIGPARPLAWLVIALAAAGVVFLLKLPEARPE